MSQAENQSEGKPASVQPHDITIGQRIVLTDDNKEAQIFTMTLGSETIELLPLRNWGQLDVFKWRVRGKLPGTPAGLEIASDHVKLAGETVSTKDPDACAKLEKLFNDWLALEQGTLEMARKRTLARPASAGQPSQPAPTQPPRFHVELDREGQVHIRCSRGKEELAVIGLNPAGFHSLVSQGFMHKPRMIKVGALHDWVELDGALFSFEKGNNDAARLEQTLNERYLSDAAFGQGRNVVVFANAASSTGFDIQFPVSVAGVPDNRRRPLSEESLDLLQDSTRCGVLPKGLVIKLSRPNVIFKQKTPDGGEHYLEPGAANTVRVIDDDKSEKIIDLSQPVNYLRLSAVELTAVFNHPAINQHSKQVPISPAPAAQTLPEPPITRLPTPPLAPPPAPESAPVSSSAVLTPVKEAVVAEIRQQPPTDSPESALLEPAPKAAAKSAAADVTTKTQARPLPNLWLKTILAQPPIRHDWFACLVYGKLAERFGLSKEGKLGPSACWAIALGETEDIASDDFKGIFLTEKGGIGFLNRSHVARFNKGVAFIGTLASALEGIDVRLVGVGLDLEQRIVFVVSEGYRAKFGVPDAAIRKELLQLRGHGALVMSVSEVLESPEPIDLVWTVPAEQENPSDPQAVESIRPEAGSDVDMGSGAIAGSA